MAQCLSNGDPVAARRNGVLVAAAFLSIVASMVVAFGYGSQMSIIARLVSFRMSSIVMLVGTACLCLAVRPYSGRPVGIANETTTGTDLPWVVTYFFLSTTMYLMLTTATAIACAVMLGCVTGVMRYCRSPASWPMVTVMLAAVGLMMLFVFRLTQLPGGPEVDVLPITQAAIRHMLALNDPYQADYGAITPMPFFYLPMEWILYLPCELIGINLRWVNFGCWLGILALFESTVHRAATRHQARLMFYPLAVSFPVFQAMGAQVPPQWLVLAVLMWALLRGRTMLVWLTLVLLLAANQTMLALGGLYASYLMRTVSPGRWLGGLALIVGSVLAVLMPFIVFSPHFLYNVFIARPALAITMWQVADNLNNAVGFSTLIHMIQFDAYRPVLQVAVLILGAAVVAAQSPASPARFLFIAGIVFLCAIGLNGQILRYYYVPPLMMIAWGGGLSFALAAVPRLPRRKPR